MTRTLRGPERPPGVALQRAEVRADRGEQRRLMVIRQTVLPRNLAHDRRQRGIVDAAHLGEQVVLDLVVQAAHVPRDQWVAVGKVGRGGELVRYPDVSHRAVTG